MIEMKDVCKFYQVGDDRVKALDHASLHIYPHEFVSIIGPSGSGKSTMMNIIGCLDVADAGEYLLDGLPMPGDMSGMTGGMTGMGSISGFGGLSGGYGGVTTSQQYELFDLDGDVIMTVTSQDSMTLSIEIDEQDIANVFPGQTAQVQINALKNETFEAVVTKVGVVGRNNGGSSKFTVELTLDKGESMLDGMSATATIPLHTVEDVPVIPVEALVEKGAQTFVYTALDKETGDPTAPVAVEVGISDTEYAQILSGLDVGTTYYYTYYDTLALPS